MPLVQTIRFKEPADENAGIPESLSSDPFDFVKRLFEARVQDVEKTHSLQYVRHDATWNTLRRLHSELSRVRVLRAEMEKELAGIRHMKETLEAGQPRVVMIRELNENDAEREIVEYLQTHDHADTGELVEKLGIDVELVLNIVQRLKEQGKVERVDAHQSG